MSTSGLFHTKHLLAALAHPPHPSIKRSLLLPLRYGRASYSSPGSKPQSVGGTKQLVAAIEILLLPSSKDRDGSGRDIPKSH